MKTIYCYAIECGRVVNFNLLHDLKPFQAGFDFSGFITKKTEFEKLLNSYEGTLTFIFSNCRGWAALLWGGGPAAEGRIPRILTGFPDF